MVLQEAFLMDFQPYGTDLSERMIEYSEKNLKWIAGQNRQKHLAKTSESSEEFKLAAGDATTLTWTEKIDAVACETYLGAPMSLPPVEVKLKEQKTECKRIVLGFLKNILPQIEAGTPLVLAVPAWKRPEGHYERMNIIDEIQDLGYNVCKLNHLSQEDMLYFRDGQIVAREIIVLRKK